MQIDGQRPRRFRLPAQRRLRRRRDFARLLEQGASVADRRLVVYAAPNRCGYSRMAVSVARRLGRAVVRNRIKRCLREAYRLEQYDLPAGYDYLLIARTNGPDDVARYRESLRALCPRAVRRVGSGRCRRRSRRE